MRCFLCIEIKDPEIISKIVQFQEELKHINAKIKFVETENLHFTLKFLGEINETMVKDIYSVMKKIPFSPFPMTLQSVGSFPPAQPRVVWVGITEGQNELAAITSFLDQNLKSLGFKPEKREFTPHLTIGRVKFIGDKKSFMSILEKRKDFQFGKMTATAILLKKSILTQKSPIYTTLEQV
jgi:RNA 2',3'-cyclic 3'-phosphodiesterase